MLLHLFIRQAFLIQSSDQALSTQRTSDPIKSWEAELKQGKAQLCLFKLSLFIQIQTGVIILRGYLENYCIIILFIGKGW